MELKEFKEKLLNIRCAEIKCKDCPLKNDDGSCELMKFKKIVKERFKEKTCKECGKVIE